MVEGKPKYRKSDVLIIVDRSKLLKIIEVDEEKYFIEFDGHTFHRSIRYIDQAKNLKLASKAARALFLFKNKGNV